MAFKALLDACVLYPAPLRDILMRLAAAKIYQARWSAHIHEEWIRNVLKARPELADRLERTRSFMDSAIPDGLVTGYGPLINGLDLPDPDDRHVLAAAIVTQANVIVTMNLRDFPSAVLAPFGIEAQHPDDFIRHALDFDVATAIGAVKAHRAALKNPPKSPAEYIDILYSQGLPKSANTLKPWMSLIAGLLLTARRAQAPIPAPNPTGQ